MNNILHALYLLVFVHLNSIAMDGPENFIDEPRYDLFKLEEVLASPGLQKNIVDLIALRLDDLEHLKTFDAMPLGDQACQNMALAIVDELAVQLRARDAHAASIMRSHLAYALEKGKLELTSSQLAYLLSSDKPIDEKEQFPLATKTKLEKIRVKKFSQKENSEINNWGVHLRKSQNHIVAHPFAQGDYEVQKAKRKIFNKPLEISAPRLIHLIDDFEKKLLDKEGLIVKFRIFEHLQFFGQDEVYGAPGFDHLPYLTIFYQVKDKKLEIISPPDGGVAMLVIDAIASNTTARDVKRRVIENVRRYLYVTYDAPTNKMHVHDEGALDDRENYPWLQQQLILVTGKNSQGKLLHDIANHRNRLDLMKLIKAATANHSPYSNLINKALAPELMLALPAEESMRLKGVGIKFKSLFNTLHVYAQISAHNEESILNPQGIFRDKHGALPDVCKNSDDHHDIRFMMSIGDEGDEFYFRDDAEPEFYDMFSRSDDLQRAIEEAVYVWNNKYLANTLLPLLINSENADAQSVIDTMQSALITAVFVGNLDALKIFKKFSYHGKTLYDWANSQFMVSRDWLRKKSLPEHAIEKIFHRLVFVVLGYHPGYDQLQPFKYHPLVAAIAQSDAKMVEWMVSADGGGHNPLQKITYPWLKNCVLTSPYALAYGMLPVTLLEDDDNYRMHGFVDDDLGLKSDAGVIVVYLNKHVFEKKFGSDDRLLHCEQGVLEDRDALAEKIKTWVVMFNSVGRAISLHREATRFNAKAQSQFRDDIAGVSIDMITNEARGNGYMMRIERLNFRKK